jgi:ATP-dependent DNA helicase RecG
VPEGATPIDDAHVTTHTARIVPLYSLTTGMTQKQIRFLMSEVLPLASRIEEWIPEDIRDRADVMPIDEALRAIHFPESTEELQHAERRLKFDELFVLQLRAEMIRQSLERYEAPAIPFDKESTGMFVKQLPFELTVDQKKAAWEILQDMEETRPMNRLLEGDVGSGKTAVAGLVTHAALQHGFQVAVMAPTEILAEQHYASFKNMLPHVTMGLLTGSVSRISSKDTSDLSKKKQREVCLSALAAGDMQVVIGTHALLTSDVVFHKLGLVIVDEQHRFGVDQRKTIREKMGKEYASPHFLSMTATPIPRSFALTLYGDLDISIIKIMPAGRKPIQTRMVAPHNRQKAYEFIAAQVTLGRQVFVICPLIQEKIDDDMVAKRIPTATEKKSVMTEYEKLSTKIFPTLRVTYLHGKMLPQEKEQVMNAFAKGEYDILVSTSVVEVGVNIPNASVMMVEGAEYFGLAQLHQFRGRVGRSIHQSYCFVFPDNPTYKSSERLEFFEKTLDGFALAEYDLATRGPGDVYGTAQSGMMQFRIATMKDTALIQLARDSARGIDFVTYPQLKNKVAEWEGRVHLE